MRTVLTNILYALSALIVLICVVLMCADKPISEYMHKNVTGELDRNSILSDNDTDDSDTETDIEVSQIEKDDTEIKPKAEAGVDYKKVVKNYNNKTLKNVLIIYSTPDKTKMKKISDIDTVNEIGRYISEFDIGETVSSEQINYDNYQYERISHAELSFSDNLSSSAGKLVFDKDCLAESNDNGRIICYHKVENADSFWDYIDKLTEE